MKSLLIAAHLVIALCVATQVRAEGDTLEDLNHERATFIEALQKIGFRSAEGYGGEAPGLKDYYKNMFIAGIDDGNGIQIRVDEIDPSNLRHAGVRVVRRSGTLFAGSVPEIYAKTDGLSAIRQLLPPMMAEFQRARDERSALLKELYSMGFSFNLYALNPDAYTGHTDADDDVNGLFYHAPAKKDKVIDDAEPYDAPAKTGETIRVQIFTIHHQTPQTRVRVSILRPDDPLVMFDCSIRDLRAQTGNLAWFKNAVREDAPELVRQEIESNRRIAREYEEDATEANRLKTQVLIDRLRQ